MLAAGCGTTVTGIHGHGIEDNAEIRTCLNSCCFTNIPY